MFRPPELEWGDTDGCYSPVSPTDSPVFVPSSPQPVSEPQALLPSSPVFRPTSPQFAPSPRESPRPLRQPLPPYPDSFYDPTSPDYNPYLDPPPHLTSHLAPPKPPTPPPFYLPHPSQTTFPGWFPSSVVTPFPPPRAVDIEPAQSGPAYGSYGPPGHGHGRHTRRPSRQYRSAHAGIRVGAGRFPR
jgi:hypothetical protein